MTIPQVSANPEPEAAALNRNDEKHETTKSLIGNLTNDGANDVTSSQGEVQTSDQTNVLISNFEVPRDNKTSDAPNYNTEFLKPAAAESALHLSNQGMKSEIVVTAISLFYVFAFNHFVFWGSLINQLFQRFKLL